MAFWAAAILGIGSAIGGAVGGSDAPNAPDLAGANKAGQDAYLKNYPRLRLIDSSAGQGKELIREGFKRTFGGDVAALSAQAQQRVQGLQAREAELAAALTQAQAAPSSNFTPNNAARNAAIQTAQERLDAARAELRTATATAQSIQSNGGEAIYQDAQGNVVSRDEALEADFTGLGDADKAGANADKMAASMLELQRKYGADFVAEARKQAEQADPEGWAARKKLFDEVMADSARVEDRTLAKTIQQQMLDELNAGGGTDAATNREIEQFLTAQQAARGGGYGKADEYERAMGVGQAAEARRVQRQQRAMAWLTSGATPEDADYRQRQQRMGNLSNFMSGTTPTAQFQSLSGAQNGAAPFVAGPGAPQVSMEGLQNAGNAGAQFAQGTYNTQSNYAAGQADPWMNAIGLGLQAYGTFNQGGGMKSPFSGQKQGGWPSGKGNPWA